MPATVSHRSSSAHNSASTASNLFPAKAAEQKKPSKTRQPMEQKFKVQSFETYSELKE